MSCHMCQLIEFKIMRKHLRSRTEKWIWDLGHDLKDLSIDVCICYEGMFLGIRLVSNLYTSNTTFVWDPGGQVHH